MIKMAVKKIAPLLTLLVLALLQQQHVHAEEVEVCLDETAAVRECTEDVNAVQLIACNGCIGAAILSAEVLMSCDAVKTTACTTIAGCNRLCGTACSDVILSKVACEISNNRGPDDACPVLDCSNDDDGDGADQDGNGSDSTTPEDDAAVCVDEMELLDGCLADDGNATSACQICIRGVAIAATYLPSCGAVATTTCTAFVGCRSLCASADNNCTMQALDMIGCEVNQLRAEIGNEACELNCTDMTLDEIAPSADCDDSRTAVDACLETVNDGAGLDDLSQFACVACLEASTLAGAFLSVCEDVLTTTCTALEGCNLLCGGDTCSTELATHVACQVDEQRRNSNATETCPLLDCSETTLPDLPDGITIPDFSGGDNSSTACPDQATALDACLSTMFDDSDADQLARLACEECVQATTLAGTFLSSCEEVTVTICAAPLGGCRDVCGGDACAAEMVAKVGCNINDSRQDNECPEFDCTDAAPTLPGPAIPSSTPPPAATAEPPAPTPPTTDMTPTPPTSEGESSPTPPPAATTACDDEDALLDECLANNGLGQTEQVACSLCLIAAARTVVSSSTCDQVTTAGCALLAGCDNDCSAASLCRSEANAKMSCDVNNMRGDEACAEQLFDDCPDSAGGAVNGDVSSGAASTCRIGGMGGWYMGNLVTSLWIGSSVFLVAAFYLLL